MGKDSVFHDFGRLAAQSDTYFFADGNRSKTVS